MNVLDISAKVVSIVAGTAGIGSAVWSFINYKKSKRINNKTQEILKKIYDHVSESHKILLEGQEKLSLNEINSILASESEIINNKNLSIFSEKLKEIKQQQKNIKRQREKLAFKKFVKSK